MKIVYVGEGPHACPLFPFEARAAQSCLRDVATLEFLPERSLSLPFALMKVCREAADGERVIFHFPSVDFADMAASLERTDSPAIVRTALTADPPMADKKGVERAAKKAAKASALLFLDSAKREALGWSCAHEATLEAPALAPGKVEVTSETPRLWVYQGEIVRDSGLEEAVRAVRDNPDLSLKVFGTGKGRWAMPAVKLSRLPGVPQRVSWEGGEHAAQVLRLPPCGELLVPPGREDEWRVAKATYSAQRIANSKQLTQGRPHPSEDEFFRQLLDFYQSL